MKVYKMRRKQSAGIIITGEKIPGFFALEVLNPFKYQKRKVGNALDGAVTALQEIGAGLIAVLGLIVSILAVIYYSLPIQVAIAKRTRSLENLEKDVERINKKG